MSQLLAALGNGETMSFRDPKIFKQLLKNNARHNIPRLIEDIKEDKRNGSNFFAYIV